MITFVFLLIFGFVIVGLAVFVAMAMFMLAIVAATVQIFAAILLALLRAVSD